MGKLSRGVILIKSWQDWSIQKNNNNKNEKKSTKGCSKRNSNASLTLKVRSTVAAEAKEEDKRAKIHVSRNTKIFMLKCRTLTLNTKKEAFINNFNYLKPIDEIINVRKCT